MTQETLNKAVKINERIKVVELEIAKCNYAQHNDIKTRKSYLKFNGIEESLVIPESLFKIISKLVLSEYETELRNLKYEFLNLK